MKSLKFTFAVTLFAGAFATSPAQAVSVGLVKVTPKASFVEDSNGLFKPLDLKTKKLTFSPSDVSKCGQVLQRKLKTLSYNCTIPIPSQANISRLQRVSKKQITVRYGRTEKVVNLIISKDAKSIKFSTEFDITGLDFEITRFNDDFFGVYSKSAQLVIKEAMNKGPIIIQVFESRRS